MKIYLTVYLIAALCINAYNCVSLFGDVQVKNNALPIYNQQPAQPVITAQPVQNNNQQYQYTQQPVQNNQQQYQYNQQQTQLTQAQMSSLSSNVMGNMQNNPAVLALLGLRALMNAGFELNVSVEFGDGDHKYLDLTTGAILSWNDLQVYCPQIMPPIQNIPQYPQYPQYPTQTSVNASVGAKANVNANSDGSLLLGSSLGKPPATNNNANNTAGNTIAKPAVASPWGSKP